MTGRQLPGGESIDIKLAAVGTGGRSSERFEVSLQFIRIVGQGFEIFSGEHDGAGIVGGVDVESGTFFLDVDLFLLNGNVEWNVELRDWPAAMFTSFCTKTAKPWALAVTV